MTHRRGNSLKRRLFIHRNANWMYSTEFRVRWTDSDSEGEQYQSSYGQPNSNDCIETLLRVPWVSIPWCAVAAPQQHIRQLIYSQLLKRLSGTTITKFEHLFWQPLKLMVLVVNNNHNNSTSYVSHTTVTSSHCYISTVCTHHPVSSWGPWVPEAWSECPAEQGCSCLVCPRASSAYTRSCLPQCTWVCPRAAWWGHTSQDSYHQLFKGGQRNLLISTTQTMVSI